MTIMTPPANTPVHRTPNRSLDSQVSTEESVLEQIDSVLALCGGNYDDTDQAAPFDFLAQSLRDARTTIIEQSRQLEEMNTRSEALARAQADAIVYSAEIIDELERTKQHLSHARSAAEEAAQDTQRLADTIFERTNDGVLVLENRRCIACNDNALVMLGQSREKLVSGWPIAFQLAADDSGNSLADALSEIYERSTSGSVEVLEAMLHRECGDAFWAEVTMSSFCMKGGGHVLVVVRDVTSRKKFEAELRRHRDFLDNIINAVPDPLSVKTCDHTLVVANDAFCRAAGINRDDVIGKRSQDLISGRGGFDVDEMDHALSADGGCPATEHRYRDNNGVERVASVKRSVFADRDSGIKYIVATSRDITDDRSREKQLQLLASVFRSASEGAVILSSDGVILEANPAFARMADVADYRELSGRSLCDALAAPIEDFRSVIAQVRGGTSWSGKIGVRDGNRVVCSYWLSLSRSADSELDDARIIALISDITDLENSQAELQRRALHDPLTGLPNRVHFREYLSDAISDPGHQCTVCFLDLDDFKHVNDSAGHSAGDELLRQVGARISENVPAGSFVARFGGDEFALIMDDSHCAPDCVSDVLNQLLAAFREPFVVEETQATVGLSIGVCRYPDDACDVDTLMQSADIAMYVAKTAGKNRIRVFTGEMQETVDLRHRVQSRLREALHQGDLSLHFQPKMDAARRDVVSCEALVRWKTPAGNYIPPSEFIPIAEQTGLIGPLGNLVFQKAAEQACEWNRQGIAPAIAVNISPHQIRDPRFIDRLKETLHETGARAEWFELEITEHAMMDDVSHAIRVTDQLSALGFRIAIDDFGTGYSSLSYLKNFRIHTLKIDISFVRDVVDDVHSQAIVKSIVSLGKGLGLTVVAEGVEDVRQEKLLREFGCDVLQGYLLGRPVPAEDFKGWPTKRKCKTRIEKLER